MSWRRERAMRDVEVRPLAASKADVAAVARLDRASFPPGREWGVGRLGAVLIAEGGRGWAVDDPGSAGEAIACLLADAPGVGLCVRRLAVDPDWRGRGLGRALLARAVLHARAAGLRHVDAFAPAEDPGAEGYFRRMGFRRLMGVPSRGRASWTTWMRMELGR